MTGADETRRATLAAALAAVLVIAGQVAGKAARDAIFLGQFHVTRLPILVMVASVLSMAGALGMSVILSRRSPGRIIPLATVGSAALLVAEAALFGPYPRPTAIVVYLTIRARKR